jgi:hypothetical protein
MQRPELAYHPAVAAVSDGFKIVRLKFGKERVGHGQGRIMDTKIFFQDTAPPGKIVQTLSRLGGAAIVAAKIRARLFAFKNSRHRR